MIWSMKTSRARNFLTGLVLAGLIAGCVSGAPLRLIPEVGCPSCDDVDQPVQATAPEPVPVTPLPVIVGG